MHVKGIESWDLAYDGRQALHRTEDGSELYYELRGTEGPVVTLVSTIYVVSTAWRNFTGDLAGDHRLLSYDLRNQGASEGRPAEFAQHTEDLKSLLDDLGIERTYLVGTSISTLICRDFANAHPERVAGLVLVGPPFSPRGSSRRRRVAKSWLAALDAGGPRALFDLIYPLVFGDKAIAEGGSGAYLALRERFLAINSAAQLRANLREALGAGDQVERLASIEAPTLLLSGDDDFSTTESTLDATAEIMRSAAVEIIRECGHLPYFEQPEAFQDAVARFVASVEDGTFPAPWTAPATEGKGR
ncbi:alpha/beta fold hydrolase [Streptomyces sp. NPDC047974]|uniref:alpha/beta fold hydrolase n=1 Tax=Streptomyces sp. NPDC047974 TaxID=3154343 RepID=UPI0033E441CA